MNINPNNSHQAEKFAFGAIQVKVLMLFLLLFFFI
jgi:hypothetical protein